MKTVYHQGELQVQELAGESMIAVRNGRIVKNEIIKGAIPFLEKQPMIIVSSADRNQKVWISALMGQEGIASVQDTQHIQLLSSKIKSAHTDIFYANALQHPQVGMLFIELSSRRRYRINGSLSPHEEGYLIDVKEAYANCPKYIQKQRRKADNDEVSSPTLFAGNYLDKYASEMIRHADTFFVGSMNAAGNLDASHRGGNKGFVEIIDHQHLRIPDYSGNSMYNTLGNFVDHPQAGLLFLNLTSGTALQLSGKAKIETQKNSVRDLALSGGTGRFWTFEIEEWIRTENHHQQQWIWEENSPYNV